MENKLELPSRIDSIDIMRGITLFLMLFVNDLFMPGVPKWLGHTAAHEDGMGLADWVFPGFLFMVGMAIPLAYKARMKNGDTPGVFVLHTFIRSASLIFIGVLMVNIGRLNPELTGINANFWALGIYFCIFLIWNKYSEAEGKPQTVFNVLKLIGILFLILLIATYRSGTVDVPGWLIPSWWGILGLIGWSYLVSSLLYVLIGERIFATLFLWIFFVVLNATSLLGYTDFLNPLKPVFGVILSGNTPSIVVAGLFSGILLSRFKSNPKLLMKSYFAVGILCLILGFILRNWFIISKIMATPSWSMLCNGLSFLLFGFLFYLIDYSGKKNWFSMFKPAGENSLTTYLAPDIIYYFVWGFNLPLFIYKQESYSSFAIFGSLLWAFLMLKLAAWLSKQKIQLRL